MARSVNMAIIVGNLTRDPELRYTPAGHAVCSFGVATNRYWTTAEGERREEAEFHNVVAWNKLAEICSQYLLKGRKVYIQGRLQTRTWEGKDGARRSRTEIVADDMVILDSRRQAGVAVGTEDYVAPGAPPVPALKTAAETPSPPAKPEAEVRARAEVKTEDKKPAKTEIGENQSANQRKSASKEKEDVNPKEMPF